jgi:hypothetical protein
MIPGSANPLLLASAAAAGPVQIERSLRFNSSDSAFCSRTPAVAGNRTTWSFSGWIKRSNLGGYYRFFTGASGNTDNDWTALFFNNSDQLTIGGYTSLFRTSNSVYRDCSAWYHLVVIADLNNANNALKFRAWINNVEVTWSSTSTNPTTTGINATNNHTIGAEQSPNNGALNSYFDGYLADIHFIDGQALTPSSFTEVSATTGQLIPLAYTGTYGTNGFHLKFADNSAATAATLGADTSGNGNNWTPNNLSVTAGAGNDSLVDTPTSYGTDTGVGNEVRGNYATWNPVAAYLAGNITNSTLSNGNLDVAFINTSNAVNQHYSTIAVSSGKWYLEWTDTSANPQTNAQAFILGVQNLEYPRNTLDNTGGYGITNGAVRQLWLNAAFTTGWWSGTPAQNDIYGIALDCDNSTISFYRNNSSLGSSQSIPAGKTYAFAITVYQSYNGTPTGSANWGQRAFAYTAPSGFKALCDTNLGDPLVAKPNTAFDTVLWTGNDTGQTITMPGAFSPDLVWTKMQSAVNNHWLFDVIRGADQGLSSSSTTNELTRSSSVTAFGSTGFTLGTNADVNSSAYTYVAWTWDAGGTTDPSNTAGSITSQVRANVSAGFSVVTYTGNGTSGATVGHGLGVAPQLLIVKRRSSPGATANWAVWHGSLTAGQNLFLNTTDSASAYSPSRFTSTLPTSTVFSLGGGDETNYSGGTFVAYCLRPSSRVL